MREEFKYNFTVYRKNKKGNYETIGFVNGNSISEITKRVKSDFNYKFRNNGIISLVNDSGKTINLNSNLF